MKTIILTHPASIRTLTDTTWDFTANTLWKRFPFYEGEIETYKSYIRKYYENIPPELFQETANTHFISYCLKILLIKIIDAINSHKSNLHTMEPIFLTNLNKDEFKELLKETITQVLNENYKAIELQAPKTLNVKQAAEFLHIEVATLYEKTSRKLIPHFKRGNKLYFNSSELEMWIKEGKVKTVDEIGIEATNYLLKKRRHGDY
jgi:excisionase family DNA binding protein